MLPGWIAGHYRTEQCAIRLRPLAQRAGAQWSRRGPPACRPSARQLLTEHGRLNSICCRSPPVQTHRWRHCGAAMQCLPLRPDRGVHLSNGNGAGSQWRAAASVARVRGGRVRARLASKSRWRIAQAARAAACAVGQLISGGALVPAVSSSAPPLRRALAAAL